MKKITAISMVATLAIASPAFADSSLATKSANEIGLSLSSYKYQEPSMENKGTKMGGDFQSTLAMPEKIWVRGDLHFGIGSVDYSSPVSGKASGNPDWYFETRGLIGKDAWAFDGAMLSPYAGLGYRYLFNDARGATNLGAVGYRRQSNYLYLPLGITYRVALAGTAQLVTEAEYDHLIIGKQFTKMSDTGLGYSDLSNNQNRGHGFKLSAKYVQDNWAVGPYANYWNIAQSEIVPLYQNGALIGHAWEPQNNTVEFGLKGSMAF